MRAVRNTLLCLAASLALAGPDAEAVEYIRDEKPAPDSAGALEGPLRESFEEPEEAPERVLLPGVKRWLQQFPDFFADSSFVLRPRTFAFLRDGRFGGGDAEAWTLGGSMAYRSGRILDTLAVGTELFTSQRLYGPNSKDGTLLLKPIQRSFTVLGTLFAELKYEENFLTLYRQRKDLPYLNNRDNRMVPNTFEAYTLLGATRSFRYAGGHVTHIKERASTDFERMSRVAGLTDPTRKGLTYFGLAWSPSERFAIGGLSYLLWDVYNTLYLEVDAAPYVGDRFELRLGFQVTDQRSFGDEELARFGTTLVGARVSASLLGAVLSLSYVHAGEDFRVQNPFGGSPSYLSLMIENFNRPGEDAVGFTFSYNFERFEALRGLSFFARFANGWNARNALTGASLADQREFNVTADYRPTWSPLEGMWLRLRFGKVFRDRQPDTRDVRVILNWELPLL